MSLDALRAFLDAAGKDPKLQEELALAFTQADDREGALAALAVAHGHEVSAADVRELVSAQAAGSAQSDEQLAQVAGGVASLIGSPTLSAKGVSVDANIWGNAMPLRKR